MPVWVLKEFILCYRDDPGLKKCFFKKGTKYCEKVQNTSMQAVSVMFWGSAAGKLYPPYVVYRALNMYPSWAKGGPKGAVYSVSKSGWIDGFTFSRCFFDLFLPVLKRIPGKKVLLSDNLATHFNLDVINACKENNIDFVCMPPNSTHLLQPLDVGCFSSLKSHWRDVLTMYKAKQPNQAGITKNDFPALLNKVMEKADLGRHLPNAFRKCGLVPVDVDAAAARIPDRNMEVDSDAMRALMDSSLSDKLEEMRGTKTAKVKQQRGNKVKIPAGKSYTAPESGGDSEEEWAARPAKQHKNLFRLESDEEDNDEDQLDNPEESLEAGEEAELLAEADEWVERSVPPVTKAKPRKKQVWEVEPDNFIVGTYVAAVYASLWYIAQVEGEEEEEEVEGYTLLRYMNRRGPNQFFWSDKPDILRTLNKDILMRTPAPIPTSSRNMGYADGVLKEVEKRFRNFSVRMLWFKIIFLDLHFLFYFFHNFQKNGRIPLRSRFDTSTSSNILQLKLFNHLSFCFINL